MEFSFELLPHEIVSGLRLVSSFLSGGEEDQRRDERAVGAAVVQVPAARGGPPVRSAALVLRVRR